MVQIEDGGNTADGEEGGGLTALIIDDQRAMRRIVRSLLKQIGVSDVIEAGSGEDALAVLTSAGLEAGRKPDFIICDLHMDHMDGLEFSNKLRLSKSAEIRHIPILMLTGDSDRMMKEVSEQVGVQVVLQKPISAPDLKAEISKAVGYAV